MASEVEDVPFSLEMKHHNDLCVKLSFGCLFPFSSGPNDGLSTLELNTIINMFKAHKEMALLAVCVHVRVRVCECLFVLLIPWITQH